MRSGVLNMSADLETSSAFHLDLKAPSASLNATARLDKRLVHKSYDENVLVSHVEAAQLPGTVTQSVRSSLSVARDRTDHFRAVLCINRDHPLLFDRDRGHVHAICFMEAAQQAAMAVAHLF